MGSPALGVGLSVGGVEGLLVGPKDGFGVGTPAAKEGDSVGVKEGLCLSKKSISSGVILSTGKYTKATLRLCLSQ